MYRRLISLDGVRYIQLIYLLSNNSINIIMEIAWVLWENDLQMMD